MSRGGGSMGAAGAFAPVSFKQRVHCTRPDEELSLKWPFCKSKRSFFSLKGPFERKKWGTISNFGGVGSPLYT